MKKALFFVFSFFIFSPTYALEQTLGQHSLDQLLKLNDPYCQQWLWQVEGKNVLVIGYENRAWALKAIHEGKAAHVTLLASPEDQIDIAYLYQPTLTINKNKFCERLFESNTFDSVLLAHAFEKLTKKEQALLPKALLKWLKDDGQVTVITSDKADLGNNFEVRGENILREEIYFEKKKHEEYIAEYKGNNCGIRQPFRVIILKKIPRTCYTAKG